jgi:hypothetical protein
VLFSLCTVVLDDLRSSYCIMGTRKHLANARETTDWKGLASGT